MLDRGELELSGDPKPEISKELVDILIEEIYKSYELASKSGFAPEYEDLKDRAVGYAMEIFSRMDSRLHSKIPILFKMARLTQEIPSATSLSKALRSDSWREVKDSVIPRKSPLDALKLPPPKVTQEFKDDFFKKLINEVKK